MTRDIPGNVIFDTNLLIVHYRNQPARVERVTPYSHLFFRYCQFVAAGEVRNPGSVEKRVQLPLFREEKRGAKLRRRNR